MTQRTAANHPKIKDWLGPSAVTAIAREIQKIEPRFGRVAFQESAVRGLETLELMARASHIASALREYLPKAIPQALNVLVQSIGPPRTSPGYGPIVNFRFLAMTRFVSRYALDYFDEGMSALYEMTRRFTAEFDLRPFILKNTAAALDRLKQWAIDPDLHVRRLVSEATRPRLPWASYLKCFRIDPKPVLKLLECLKDDPEVYVRRSVANNLADILKDDAKVAIEMLEQWAVDASPERKWIIRHALRMPRAYGEARALKLSGLTGKPKIQLSRPFLKARTVPLGTDLEFSFAVRSTADEVQRVIISYRLNRHSRSRVSPMKPFHVRTGE